MWFYFRKALCHINVHEYLRTEFHITPYRIYRCECGMTRYVYDPKLNRHMDK